MTGARSCVGKDGRFIVGVHTPRFEVKNLRNSDHFVDLGRLDDGTRVDNTLNFPEGDVLEPRADTIYEIANPFSFRGTTYINSAWADPKAARPEMIRIPRPKPCSLVQNFEMQKGTSLTTLADTKAILDLLPHPLLIALAQASTDSKELVLLAKKSCRILFDPDGRTPVGMGYRKKQDRIVPDIYDHELFEVLVNNPCLPDDYKNVLVLKPGVQGNNEIVGEYLSDDGKTHVFEYLRRNSYIPWGHFAANMANDAIRYRARDLSMEDMKGIRHLYYQRALIRLATELDIAFPDRHACLDETELETLRLKVLSRLHEEPAPSLLFDSTLWGWNFGYGYAQSGHRLHASHQMIHQQNAMIPKSVPTQSDIVQSAKVGSGKSLPSFACGDLIQEFIRQFKKTFGKPFFDTYLAAVRTNTRTDGRTDAQSSLVVAEDEHTILFVPKAQVSEWELQLMPKTACGNILEADTGLRRSLDRAILTAVQVLESLGAQFVTSIEFSKRFDERESDQRLLYSFLPRLPYAPDTFSEAQLRWISGTFPEDFAHACRIELDSFLSEE